VQVAALQHARLGQQRAGSRHGLGPAGQDPADARVAAQDLGQEHAVAAHVDHDRAEREVVAVRYRAHDLLGARGRRTGRLE
jgi:hypothetical protein